MLSIDIKNYVQLTRQGEYFQLVSTQPCSKNNFLILSCLHSSIMESNQKNMLAKPFSNDLVFTALNEFW